MPSITDALSWMLTQARRDDVGYSQDFRNFNEYGNGQLVTYQMAYNQDYYGSYNVYDGGAAHNYLCDYKSQNEVHAYYDCSSAIFYALLYAGYPVGSAGNAFTTHGMDSILLNCGFSYVSGSALIAGDIGVWNDGDSGHTWMITSACNQNSMNTVEAKGRNSTGTAVNFADQFLEITGRVHAADHFYRSADSTGEEVDPMTKDVSLYCVAAMAGNFWWEAAGINPAVWEFSATEHSWTALGEGYGLAQWTNTDDKDITQGRLYKLYQWMTANGYAMTSGTGQVRYIFEENVWHTYYDYQSRWSINSLEEFLNCGWTDLNDLTECWMDCFEGIQDSSLSQRQEHAKYYYDYINKHKDDESITKWKYNANYGVTLSEEDAENNAVMLYRCVFNNYNEYGYNTGSSEDFSSTGSGNNGNGGYGSTSSQYGNDSYNLIDALYALLGSGGAKGADALLKILTRRGK